ISAGVALTLVPMLSGRWLRRESEEHLIAPVRWSLDAFDRVAHGYAQGLAWVLERQRLVLLLFAGTLALTALLAFAIPKGLFPEQDTGQLQA
ncbi:efflux RND transporter permease subunit, partial [Marinobacter sp. 71-i]